MNFKHMREYVGLVNQMKKIVDVEDVDWETKYELIFSDDFSLRLQKLYHIDYYDPDTDYESDVRAFVSACEDKAEEFQKLLDAIES